MDAVSKVLGVVVIAIVELWAAVPAGAAMGLPVPVVWLATLAGALLGVTVVVLVGDRLRAWLVDKFGHGGAREGGRLRRLWDRYGVIGWGLLAPLLLGAPLAAAIGVALGAARWRLVLWLGAGVVLWTSVLAAAVAYGADVVTSWV